MTDRLSSAVGRTATETMSKGVFLVSMISETPEGGNQRVDAAIGTNASAC